MQNTDIEVMLLHVSRHQKLTSHKRKSIYINSPLGSLISATCKLYLHIKSRHGPCVTKRFAHITIKYSIAGTICFFAITLLHKYPSLQTKVRFPLYSWLTNLTDINIYTLLCYCS
jgi:hypothetical protein